MEVMLTDLGHAALGERRPHPNVMPRRLADFTAFARAIAMRYSGRFSGYPFVRFWAVWNEPNLGQFLSPQFNGRGQSVAPANYAKLYAAAYAGLKAGSPRALVAIGETSPRGSDRATGIRPTHSPGKFAELVAKANPRLRFDAWAHHPSPPTRTRRRRSSCDGRTCRFARSRASTRTSRSGSGRRARTSGSRSTATRRSRRTLFGVSYARQSAYIRQSMNMARRLRT